MKKFFSLTLTLAAMLSVMAVSAQAADYSFETDGTPEYYPSSSYEDVYGSRYNYGGKNVVDYQIPELEYGQLSTTQTGVMEKIMLPGIQGISASGSGIYGISPGGGTVEIPGFLQGGSTATPATPAFTELTQDFLLSNGAVGKISIPAIGVKNYYLWEGETTASMKKGLGHFTSTSVWNGNVAVCGHNRGAKYVIGSIKDLDVGDKITYTTSMGTRTYLVETVTKISSSDWSYLSSTTDNRMTLLSGASGAAGQPILNDNAAITENVNQAAFAINQILGEGIENVQERIANDFAGTDGDHYEVVNPYEGDLISNANLFISQYCAAKNLDFAAISLTDMEQILRAGLTHLYSFSRTMEVRTVPAEEDGEEDTAETWYIYTIRYNGEAYFADTIFALTDEQKGLAENYAENLSLFLGDGLFQYAPSTNTITALGDVRFTDGETEVIYFNQLDERYANQPYGTDHIGGYGCGPTSMAIVVSSLTGETVDPVQMARWAYEHGYWCSKSGSYHTLIPGAAQAWGLSVEGCTASEPQRILDALADGKLVVALMTKGHFTKSGHFIVLRGVQDEKILVADPASCRRSQKAWDLSIILNEASRRAGAGGPFWIIG